MALQVSALQGNLAYRLGETAAISSTTTTGILRLEWLNMGYFDIARRFNWWFLEATDTTNTNTGSTTGYVEPTDLKEFIELKIGTIYYEQVPYKRHQNFDNSLSNVVTILQLKRSYKFYRFAGRYYLIPTDSNDATTHTIKYWKRVTKRTLDTDTFLIPDEYLEALTAFAEARYWMSITQQAKAQAAFQEFEQVIEQMKQEQARRGWGSPGWSIHDPEDFEA